MLYYFGALGEASRLYRFLIAAPTPAILLSYLAVSFPTSASYLRRYRLACRPTRMYMGRRWELTFRDVSGEFSPPDSPIWILSNPLFALLSSHCIYTCVYWKVIKVCFHNTATRGNLRYTEKNPYEKYLNCYLSE